MSTFLPRATRLPAGSYTTPAWRIVLTQEGAVRIDALGEHLRAILAGHGEIEGHQALRRAEDAGHGGVPAIADGHGGGGIGIRKQRGRNGDIGGRRGAFPMHVSFKEAGEVCGASVTRSSAPFPEMSSRPKEGVTVRVHWGAMPSR